MNILYFAPAATPENPSMCPFITQRIFELQKQGHNVITVQFGNLTIYNYFVTKRTGFLKVVALLYKLVKYPFIKNGGQLKEFKNNIGSFKYFDSLNFKSYKAFYKWYKKQRFEIIHAHFLWFSKLLPELKSCFGIPYVVTLHGSDIHELTPYDKTDIEQMINILKNADSVIFVSNFLLNHAKSLGYDGNNAKIIYNGINHNLFFVNNGYEEKEVFPYLGFIGHPNFIKRSYILPYVLKIVKKEFPNAKLLILGSENGDLLPYIKYITWKNNLMDSIEFISAVPPEQVAKYMQKIDVLLLPSHNEGLPCVAIEAQACGVGVVASSNGGIPETVGYNGICVQDTENFITDYANAIIKWLKEKHNKEEIAQSVKDYTWENCVKQEIDVYKSIKYSFNSKGGEL